MLIEIFVGLLLGIVLVLLVRKYKQEGWLYSAVLVSLPLIYVTYALVIGDFSTAVKELLVGGPFLIGGFWCLMFRVPMSARITGILWLMHALFDVAHGLLFVNHGVPEWYPLFCGAVDTVIGSYLVLSKIFARRLI
ncbi:hypothetical protein MJA45_05660 [Paenibacillus aurantius]|uniref:Uncharacterized protein n=1 Tax=Paenibacillus aurantius TaxID=2918900 RepID=A0AA96LED6_9BACL|nr:hypothetical protein [Paenibacillus aurantius]WNQ12519.1 hypothetical protein MJA45_05660 [Paenibacillus aurantius]